MTYPTATQALHDALRCVDGPPSILAPELAAAIERAQWAAVREALMGFHCDCIYWCYACRRGAPDPHLEERFVETMCRRCVDLAKATQHLEEAAP